nr:T9SS type A sorting domain-containing protein [uncultured Psychroserpens sp.]
MYAYENYPVGSTPEEGYAQWRDLSESDILNTGLSFTMKGSGAGDPVLDVQNYVFVGKPNNALISTPLTIGNQALVGNPYPSAIDANQFIRDNLPGASGNAGSTQSTDGTLYFWEHYASNFTHVLEDYEGGYATYNLSGGNPAVSPPLISGNGTSTKLPGQYVPVSQGFFVTASHLGGQIQFKNSQRVFARETGVNSEFIRSNNPNIYTSQDYPNPGVKRIRLDFITQEGAKRPLLLAFVPSNQATDGFDYGYDAVNSDAEFSNDMFWDIEGEDYTTQGVGDFDDSKQYPLVVYISTSGLYEISLNGLENFEEAINLYIYDALLDSYVDITENTFQMVLDADTYTNRFFIAFSEEAPLSTVDEELNLYNISYFNSTHEIYAKMPNNFEVKKIQLINLLGQEILSWSSLSKFEFDGAIRIPVKNLTEGAYVIKLTTTKSTYSRKIVVNN